MAWHDCTDDSLRPFVVCQQQSCKTDCPFVHAPVGFGQWLSSQQVLQLSPPKVKMRDGNRFLKTRPDLSSSVPFGIHPFTLAYISSASLFQVLIPERKATLLMNTNPAPDNGGFLDWGKHEAEIRDLFLKKKMKLPALRRHMKEKHGFDATYVFFLLSSLAWLASDTASQ